MDKDANSDIWISLTNKALEDVKPVTLVSMILEVLDNPTTGQVLVTIAKLKEIYWPVLKNNWDELKLLLGAIFDVLRRQGCRAMAAVRNTGQNGRRRLQRRLRVPTENIGIPMQDLNEPDDTAYSDAEEGPSPRDMGLIGEEDSEDDEIVVQVKDCDSCPEQPSVPPPESLTKYNLKWLKDGLKRLWLASREGMVAACASIMTCMCFIGSLFPEFKFVKKCSDRFMAMIKTGGALRGASGDSMVYYDALKQSVGITMGESLAEGVTSHDDIVVLRGFEMKIKIDPYWMVDPAFPLQRITGIRRMLDTAAKSEKQAYKLAILKAEIARADNILDRRSKMKDRVGSRCKPTVLVLAGEPGVGKTQFINDIAADLNEEFGVEGYDSWQCNLTQQDQMLGKPVLCMEEFGLRDFEKDTADLMRLADTNVFISDNDKLENKDRTEQPIIILVSTNAENIYKGCKYPEALSRRVDLHVYAHNSGLAAWKAAHKGKRPNDKQLKTIFGACDTEYTELPPCACDWRGDYKEGTVVKHVPLVNRSSGYILDFVTKTTKRRMKVYKDMVCSMNAQALDVPIYLFLGPPGCGKTTLATDVCDDVINDPWLDDKSWEDMVSRVMHAEDNPEEGVFIVTANTTPFETRMEDMLPEAALALMRRFTIYTFEYNWKNFFGGCYGPKDITPGTWARKVSVSTDGQAVSRACIMRVIREATPANKRTSDAIVPIAAKCKVLAVTSLTTAMLADKPSLLKIFRSFTVLDKGFPAMTEILRVLQQVSMKSCKYESPMSFIVAINDSGLAYGNTSPRAVEFKDVTIRFESINGRLVASMIGPTEEADVFYDAETGSVTGSGSSEHGSNDTEYTVFEVSPQNDESHFVLPGSIFELLGHVLTTICGMVGIGLQRRFSIQSPDLFEVTGESGKRTRNVESGVKVNVSGPEWDGKFRAPSWADGNYEMNYEEIVLQNNPLGKCVYPVTKGSARVSWAVSTSRGVLVNKHAIRDGCRVGNVSFGKVKMGNIDGTDLAFLPPHRELTTSNLAWSGPTVGEKIYRWTPEGKSVSYTVVKSTTVVYGGPLKVFLLRGPPTIAGDCGSPYFRLAGSAVEILGIHTGMLGQSVVCTPLVCMEMQAGGKPDKTYIYRTQLPDETTKRWVPSPKCGTFEGVEYTVNTFVERCSKDFFVVRPERRVCIPALKDSIEYVRTFSSETTPWSTHAVIRSLDMSTSAGPHWGVKKREMFDEEGCIFPRYAREWHRALNDIPDGSCSLSIKDELRPETKAAVGGSRTIFCFNVHQVVRAKRYIGPVMKDLIDTVGSSVFGVGLNVNDGSWGEVAERLSRYKYHIDADFSGWDKSVNRGIMEQAIEVLVSCVIPENRDAARCELLAMARAKTQFGETQGGLPSGVVGTSHLNCIIHILLVSEFLQREKLPQLGSMGCPVDFICYGDDIVLATDVNGLIEKLCTVWAELGFHATNTQKTGPPAPAPFKEMSFLKRSFLRRKDVWYAPLEMESINRAMAFGRGMVPYGFEGEFNSLDVLGARLSSLLQSVFSEVYQHGEKEYNLMKNRMIGWAASNKARLPLIIPPFEKFDMRLIIIGAVDDSDCVKHSIVSSLVFQSDMDRSENANGNILLSGASGSSEVVGVPSVMVPLVEPTVGMQAGAGMTGGTSIMDPAVRQRFAGVPGGILSISTNLSAGTNIFMMEITPAMNVFTLYLQNMYNAWAGGFEVQLVIGGNKFIGGKLLAVYTPPGVKQQGHSIPTLLGFAHAILDLGMMDGVVLPCSDIKNVMWHRTGDTGPAGTGGTLGIYIMTKIVTAGTGEVTMDLVLLSKPSEDFDFACLLPPVDESGIGRVESGAAIAEAASTPAVECRFGVVTAEFLAIRKGIPVSGAMWNGSVTLEGDRNAIGGSGAGNVSGFKCVVKGGADPNWTVLLYDDEDQPWDQEGDISGTYPPTMGFPTDGVVTLTAFDTNGLPSATHGRLGNNPSVIWTSGPKLQIGKEYILTPGPTTKSFTTTTFTPGNGESVLAYRTTSDVATTCSLQTVDTARLLIRSPYMIENSKCLLFNMVDDAGPTGVQCKLYPNGVMTTGGVTITTVFPGNVSFNYVSEVSRDYKMAGPRRNAEYERLVENLRQWQVQQQQEWERA